MIEIKEVLRLWLAGHSLRDITRLAGLDRKTVRRYVQAAHAVGVSREGGDAQLSEEILGSFAAVVRPQRPRGPGAAWETHCRAPRPDRDLAPAGPHPHEDPYSVESAWDGRSASVSRILHSA